MNFYEFAQNNPYLTFFLAMMLGSVIIGVAEAFGGKL